MRRWTQRLAVVALLAAAAIALRATLLRPEPELVRAVAVERGRVETTLTNSKAGTVTARRRARLSSGTSGVVTELAARRGDVVARGDVLVRLDDATQRAQHALALRALDVAVATHAEACLAAERAHRELERNRELSRMELISVDLLDKLQSVWELAVAECDVAAARVERERAAVEVAQAELDKTVLRAPFDAIVAEVAVELGEWVTPSVPLLAAPDVIDAVDPSSLYIAAPMDEVDAARLSEGLLVRATVDSHPERVFPGRVVRVAPYVLDVEQQNRTVEIEVELDDQAFSRTLLPGTSADVEVVLETLDDVLRIPTFALLEGGRVLVVEDGRLVEREVGIGMRNWEYAQVVSGLQAGERVVTSLDRSEVRAGAQVLVEAAP